MFHTTDRDFQTCQLGRPIFKYHSQEGVTLHWLSRADLELYPYAIDHTRSKYIMEMRQGFCYLTCIRGKISDI